MITDKQLNVAIVFGFEEENTFLAIKEKIIEEN